VNPQAAFASAAPPLETRLVDLVDLLGLDTLLAQIILAIGGAMLAGNGFAIVQHLRGRSPRGAEGGFRAARAWWLLGVGALITLWGAASLIAG
jgi:hypothetical protein